MTSRLEQLPDALAATVLSFFQPQTVRIEKQPTCPETIYGGKRVAIFGVLASTSRRLQNIVNTSLVALNSPDFSLRKICGSSVRTLDLREYQEPLPQQIATNAFQQLPRLETLRLPFAESPHQFANFHNLKELDATKASYDLTSLQHFPFLEKLSVHALSPANAPHLSHLRHLKCLCIEEEEGNRFSAERVTETLTMITKYLPNIRELIFPKLFFADQVYNLLALLPSLQVIRIGYFERIQPHTLKLNVPSLRKLYIEGNSNKDAVLGPFPNLQTFCQTLGPDIELILSTYYAFRWEELEPALPYLQNLTSLMLSFAPRDAEILALKNALPQLQNIIIPLYASSIALQPRTDVRYAHALRIKQLWPAVSVVFNRMRVELTIEQLPPHLRLEPPRAPQQQFPRSFTGRALVALFSFAKKLGSSLMHFFSSLLH